ncbi:hypothetical protein Purlil1_6573 [Purpureocillium lilacinum]|uniref:Ornithine cyclodeaminase n=1 Tax=Purpureocillium lilacinum TaxID=33203 RepID=A0ABR0BYU8_PURLI|nr:hypothetical protein Purlil1_6573 [Purpureocillium lilacinum]
MAVAGSRATDTDGSRYSYDRESNTMRSGGRDGRDVGVAGRMDGTGMSAVVEVMHVASLWCSGHQSQTVAGNQRKAQRVQLLSVEPQAGAAAATCLAGPGAPPGPSTRLVQQFHVAGRLTGRQDGGLDKARFKYALPRGRGIISLLSIAAAFQFPPVALARRNSVDRDDPACCHFTDARTAVVFGFAAALSARQPAALWSLLSRSSAPGRRRPNCRMQTAERRPPWRQARATGPAAVGTSPRPDLERLLPHGTIVGPALPQVNIRITTRNTRTASKTQSLPCACERYLHRRRQRRRRLPRRRPRAIMTFTVLTDEQVNSVLEGLDLNELDEFRHVLASALHEFSTNTQADNDGVYQQPHRVTTYHPGTRATTLYMPSCGPEGMGCKVVSLTSSAATRDPSVKPISPTGVVNLFSPDGKPLGLVHASTLTAFRTALSSACLLSRRNHVKTITVFGSGNQAYWHVRLALMMRGSTIKHVNVINRRFSESAAAILKRFTVIPQAVKEREGWSHTKFGILTPTFHEYERLLWEQVRSSDVIYCCTPSREDLFDASILTSREGRMKGRLIVAVGSYTPEMRELPEALLLQATKHHDKNARHFHKHAEEAGVIVVDTLDGVLKEAGEIMAAKIGPHQLVELGELVMLHRLAVEESGSDTTGSQTPISADADSLEIGDRTPSMSTVYSDKSRRAESPSGSRSPGHSRKPSFPLPFRSHSGSSSDTTEKKKEDSLARWLRDGTVVYKSVGLGLMDLVVGMHLVQVASEKKVGTQIEGF